MNQKTAKFLRKASKELFAKLENPAHGKELIENETGRKYYRHLLQDSDGNPVINEKGELQFSNADISQLQMAANNELIVHGIYRAMKKDYKLSIV